MISGLITLLSGPLLGIFGSVISGVTGYFERKQKIEERREEMAHERSLQELNMKARGQEIENEQAIATMNADSRNLAASYKHDASVGETSIWVNNTLRLVRPVLTIYLLSIVTYLVVANTAGLTIQEIAMKVLFLAEVAVSWWFADRRRAAASK